MNWLGGIALGIVAAIVMVLWESRSTAKRIVAAVIGTSAGLVTLVVIAEDMETWTKLDWASTLLFLAGMYLYHRVEKQAKCLEALQNDVAELKRQLSSTR